MTNYYFNDFLLNPSTLERSGVTSRNDSKRFNVNNKDIYGKKRGVNYITSGTSYDYKVDVTLASNSNVWSLLLEQESLLSDYIESQQIDEKKPILFWSDNEKVFKNYKGVYLLIENASYPHKATDGKHLLNLTFDCVVIGVPSEFGGTIESSEIYNITSI